ncbi:MAG: ion transporter [Prochloraceae cyanobacterium]
MSFLRKTVAYYLEDFETPIGLAIDLIILGLILLSLGMFVAETYPLSPTIQSIFHWVDLGILIIFSIEYLIRFWCAESKVKFFFSLFSLIDLLAIFPLLFGWMDMRFMRIFRWFRLLRIIRFLDFEVSIFRIQTEDGIILTRILLTLFSIIVIYSGLIYQVEHQINPGALRNFFDSLYFCIVTMTTVGFGDIAPLSDQGRALTLLMIMTGVTFIPWQIKDLIEQLLKTTTKIKKECSSCGLSLHDADANHCKICGTKLKTNNLCE